MKNLILSMCMVALSTMGFGQVYNNTHVLKDGSDNSTDVTFYVMSEHTEGGFFETIMDSTYNNQESAAFRVLSIANVYAKLNCKYKLSWVPTSFRVMYDEENNYYFGGFKGTATNAYGVRDEIQTLIKIDMEGNVGPF